MAGSRRARPRDLLEEIEISPVERWRRYGAWPFRQLAHALVLVTTLLHFAMVEEVLAGYSQNFERNCFNLIFAGSLQHDVFSRHGGFDLDSEDFHANQFVVFNTSDARQQLVDVVRNYFALSRDTVDDIVVANPHDPQSAVPLPLLRLSTAEDEAGDDNWVQVRSPADLGPLAPRVPEDKVADYIHRLEAMELVLALESHNPAQWYLTRDPCVLWTYRFTYTRTNGAGPFFANIQQDSQRRCEARVKAKASTPIIWLQSWLIVVCLIHVLWALERVARGVAVIQVLQRALAEPLPPPGQTREARLASAIARPRSSSRLQALGERLRAGSEPARQEGIGWEDKLAIINQWNLLSLLADAFLLLYSGLEVAALTRGRRSLLSEQSAGWMSSVVRVLLGGGCGLHLISLLEYAEYSLVDYLLLQVNRAARSEVFVILVGVVPITMAYVVLGVCLFGNKVSRFGNFRNTAATLFGVCLGDELWPTYMDLMTTAEVPNWVAGLYLTSFVLVHLYVVGMSVLAVVEEAFISEGLWLLDMSERQVPEAKPSPAAADEAFLQVLWEMDCLDAVMDGSFDPAGENSPALTASSAAVARSLPRRMRSLGADHGESPLEARLATLRSGGSATSSRSARSPPLERARSGVALHVSRRAAELLRATDWQGGRTRERHGSVDSAPVWTQGHDMES